jgi:hypothetical protein
VYLDGCALSKCRDYVTPLGNLRVDEKGPLFLSSFFSKREKSDKRKRKKEKKKEKEKKRKKKKKN